MDINSISFTFTDVIRENPITIRVEEPVGAARDGAAVFIGIDTPDDKNSVGFYLTEQQLEELQTILYSVRYSKAD